MTPCGGECDAINIAINFIKEVSKRCLISLPYARQHHQEAPVKDQLFSCFLTPI